jgi:hypothetical protein
MMTAPCTPQAGVRNSVRYIVRYLGPMRNHVGI